MATEYSKWAARLPSTVRAVQRSASVRTSSIIPSLPARSIRERSLGPILRRPDGQRLDRRTAHRWVRSIGKRAGLGAVHPHMLRAAFIMAALDAGVPLRDVQLAASHADPPHDHDLTTAVARTSIDTPPTSSWRS